MKKTTFEYMQSRYTNQCNLFWFKMKEIIETNGITKMPFETYYELCNTNSELKQHKTIMDEVFYICHLEGKDKALDTNPKEYALNFMNKFFAEIYTE